MQGVDMILRSGTAWHCKTFKMWRTAGAALRSLDRPRHRSCTRGIRKLIALIDEAELSPW